MQTVVEEKTRGFHDHDIWHGRLLKRPTDDLKTDDNLVFRPTLTAVDRSMDLQSSLSLSQEEESK